MTSGLPDSPRDHLAWFTDRSAYIHPRLSSWHVRQWVRHLPPNFVCTRCR